MDPVSVDINLLPADSIPDTVASQMTGKASPVRQDGWIWIRSGCRVIRWKDDAAGEAVLKMMAEVGPASGKAADPWRILLEGGTPDVCPPEMKDGIIRCVILFEAVTGQEKLLKREMLTGLAPVEQGDVITEAATGKVALIKVTADHTDEEIREYAAAVIETVETEAGIPVQAGIGCCVSSLAGLADSIRQAERAIGIGRQFCLDGSVFAYNQQIIERLISAVSPEERSRLRREVFTQDAEKLMSDEMMETVRIFFRNDLNLSTAARQLFIHRNTLIYRLDKIRRQTGFDLRKFEDAAAFRLLCRLPADPKNHDYP